MPTRETGFALCIENRGADDLEIRIQFPPGAMHFQVMLAGKEHVLLNLPRLEGAAAQSVRQELATRRAP